MKKLFLTLIFLTVFTGCDDDNSNNSNNTNSNNTNNSNNSTNNTNNVNPCDGVNCSGHGQCVVSGSAASCDCDEGWVPSGLTCVEAQDPCTGIDCSGHGDCSSTNGTTPICTCDNGYVNAGTGGLECIEESNDCTGVTCSNHGTCVIQSDGPVCACENGYTPSASHGLDCVPVDQVCIGGAIDYDFDNDGTNDTWFEPNSDECLQYEILNRTRATHDDEGTPECHKPLMWNVLWAAHGRNHSIRMANQGSLFHDDYPSGQNCAYGCGPDCEMNMYMTGEGEDHCPPLSHHCNIMRCSFTQVGIGYSGTWNTQNFL
ncbi:hypothetical protein KKF34_02555 [Myxococcota bacterium]|nr:hypothetical protein [Myxococcota bacterium]MBU1379618.1 hypothetical protein [Myxococcota bacterium]MBU1495744.1 hypothetical protein [Myxococcota bacterium]